MNNFNEMIKYIIDIYKNAVDMFPIDEEKFTNLLTSGEIYDISEYNNRLSYVCDNIYNLEDTDSHFFDDMICLLSIYYFIVEYDNEPYYEGDEHDENEKVTETIIENMINMNKDEYLDYIKNDEDDPLSLMISVFLDNELTCFSDENMKKAHNFSENIPYNLIKKSNEDKIYYEVMSKLHPDIINEYLFYSKLEKNNRIYEKLNQIKITGISSYITYKSYLDNLIINEEMDKSILNTITLDIILKDEKLFKDISLFLLKIYYVDNCMNNKKDKEELRKETLTTLEYINKGAIVFNSYIDFKFSEFTLDFLRLEKDDLNFVNNLSVNIDKKPLIKKPNENK